MSRGISQTDYGMLRSTMSDGSVASLLNRSAGWVARTRRQISEQDDPTSATGADTEHAGPGEIGGGGASLMTPVSKVEAAPAQQLEPMAASMDGGASPIKSRVLVWCRAYRDQGVDLTWLAWAFELDAADLRFALEGGR